MQTREFDAESESFLNLLANEEKIRTHRVAGVRTVLVILSTQGLVFDIESLKQKVLLSYPDSAVFFANTSGRPTGVIPPAQVDLLIDMTGPGQRQGMFLARKLRRQARVAVGRNAGMSRTKIYDHVFDEKAQKSSLPVDPLARERIVQREVLALAGVAMAQMGDTGPDRGKTIALELPAFKRL